MKYTRQSFLGLIFEKIYFTDQHMFALPNKFFDYMHAGIPVLSSKAVEIKSLIEKYNTGDFIDSFEPEKIAEKIIEISNNEELYNLWKHNTCKASEELNWETEEKILVNFMQHLR
jgi:glycosyltransferase involved in cell wall biosynthesis